jgi:predicted outer membrane protein
MTPIIRRTFLVALAVAPVSHATLVHAVDALPDARFVAFAETVNDFEIKSGQLALTKSQNELVRGYATPAVAEHTTAAQSLAKNRAEAGVSMAPDEDVRKISDDAMARLNSLQGGGVRHRFRGRPATCANGRSRSIRRLFTERQERASTPVRARDAAKVAGIARVRQAARWRSLNGGVDDY